MRVSSFASKPFLVAAFFAHLTTIGVVVVVDGAASLSTTVACHPKSTPGVDEICVGEMLYTTPSPVVVCEDYEDRETCETVGYEGGYTFNYVFVEGLADGTELYDFNQTVQEEARTGLEVMVALRDDRDDCRIIVNGNETCASCFTCGVDRSIESYVAFNCTNIENGRASIGTPTQCEALLPVFYPLEFATDGVSSSSPTVAVANPVPSSPGPTPNPTPQAENGREEDKPRTCSSYEACSAFEGDCCPTPDGVFLSCCNGIENSPTTVPQFRPEDAACSLYPVCVEAGLTADVGGEADCCPDDDGEYLACCYGTPNDEEVDNQPPPPSNDDGDNNRRSCSAHEACSASEGDCCPTADGVFLSCCDGIENSPTTVPQFRPEDAACSLYPVCVEAGLTADVGGEADCCPDDDGEYLACCYGTPNDEEVDNQPPPPSNDDGDNNRRSCSAHEACSASEGDCCPTTDGVFLVCCDGIENSPTTVPQFRPENAACSLYPTCVEAGLTADVGGEADCCPDDDGEYLACCYDIPNEEEKENQPPPPPPENNNQRSCSSHEACAGLEGDCCPTAEGLFLVCCDGIESSPTTVPQFRPENAACSIYPTCVEAGLTAELGGEALCCPDDDGEYLACCQGIPNEEEEDGGAARRRSRLLRGG